MKAEDYVPGMTGYPPGTQVTNWPKNPYTVNTQDHADWNQGFYRQTAVNPTSEAYTIGVRWRTFAEHIERTKPDS